MASLRNYLESLSTNAKDRYLEKIKLVDNTDTYTDSKKTWSRAAEDYPDMLYSDIMAYLILTIGAYTNEELKNYNSLEAYNQFVC